ncbi:hypothetical protein AB0K47_01415 [Streptomyces tirandamycinicus]|uniref:hypothetical protein n=1 Tax=Streptomyces tirandamycinicus TaxID=2174846 RepID=UPI0034302F8A
MPVPTGYKVHMGVSLFLAGLAATAVVLTLLPGRAVVPEAAAFTLFGLMFPLFGGAVLRCHRVGLPTRGPDFLLALWLTPRWLRAAAGALVAVVVLCVAIGGAPAAGQPERTAEGYYLTHRGGREPVSRAVYESALKSGVRWFDAGATFFLAVSAVTVAAAHRAEEETLAGRRGARGDA